MAILENIDIAIGILKNINKISYPLGYGISNTPIPGSQRVQCTKYIYVRFAGETQNHSASPINSATFPATLAVTTSKQLPTHQGFLSFILYISQISQL